jgi:hypothetical protein
VTVKRFDAYLALLLQTEKTAQSIISLFHSSSGRRFCCALLIFLIFSLASTAATAAAASSFSSLPFFFGHPLLLLLPHYLSHPSAHSLRRQQQRVEAKSNRMSFLQ